MTTPPRTAVISPMPEDSAPMQDDQHLLPAELVQLAGGSSDIPPNPAELTTATDALLAASGTGDAFQAERRLPLFVQANRLLISAIRGRGNSTKDTKQAGHERGRIRGKVEKIIRAATAAGVLAVAACSSGGHAGAASSQTHPSRIKGPPSATAAAGNTSEFHANIWDQLGGNQNQDVLQQERAELAHAPPDLLVPTNKLSKAVDYEAAKVAVNDGPDPDDPDTLHQAMHDAAHIKDDTIHAEAVGAVEATYIKSAVSNAANVTNDNGDFDPTGAEASLKKDLAIIDSDPQVMPAAEDMLSIEAGGDLISGFIPSDPPTAEDLRVFKQQADKLGDPEARKIIMRAAEAKFGSQLLLDLENGTGGIDKAKALKLISDTIENAKVKQLLSTALETYTPDDIGGGNMDDEDQLTALNHMADPSTTLGNLEQQKQDQLAGVSTSNTDTFDDYFGKQADNAIKQDQAAVNRELYAYNGHVTEGPMDTIEPLPDPKEKLDLTHVHASTVIPNVGRFNPPEGEQNQEPATYNQFAEIYAQGGELHFRINADSGLDDQTVALLDNVFNNVKPILEASFARGDVINIHFVAVTNSNDYNPGFSPVPHEIYMTLLKNKAVSAEELQSMLVHETAHSLVRGIFGVEKPVSDSDKRMILSACDAMRNSSYDALKADLDLFPGLLNQLQAQAEINSPDDAPLFEALIKAVKSGDVNAVFNADQGGNAVINSCQQRSLNLLFYTLALNDPHYPKKYFDSTNPGSANEWNDHFEKVIMNLKGFDQLNTQWNDATSTYLIYSTLNESKYLDKYGVDPNLEAGHTDANADEVVASVFDDVVNFPQAFGKAIGALPNDAESGHMRDTALRAVRMSLALIVERNESLAEFCDEKMQRLVIWAGESPNNARYWLPITNQQPQSAAA